MFLRLEKIIFYLFIFCLPLQIRTIVYQWSVNFNEWISAYIYLSDILILSLFVFWAFRNRKNRFLKKGFFFKEGSFLKRYDFWLFTFVLISFISLFKADNFFLGFYSWLKLLEMVGLFFYIKANYGFIIKVPKMFHALIAAGFLQAVIAIFQYGGQESIGLRVLRESPLNHILPGIAKLNLNGFDLIRAYGTMPHPNVLAAFLAFVLFFIFFVWLNKMKSPCEDSRKSLFIILEGFLLIAFGLTFSRVAISFFVLTFLFYFAIIFLRYIKNKDKIIFKKAAFIFLTTTVFVAIFYFLAWPEISARFDISVTEQAITLRNFLKDLSFSVISQHPIIGLGFGNFVWVLNIKLDLFYSWVHQPVHNVYLLIAAETGLLGLTCFLLFVWQLIRSAFWSFRIKHFPPLLFFTLFSILVFFFSVGLFDHFLWTLQQGRLMLWLVLGLLAANIYENNSS